ncbi:g6868 [Coccomyxa viridis]|uniref:G6868 protein n=1 Tax=Coccomyxa viridis TaxID=1274662 RepID=A0ABP1FWG9_9CHLO
MALQFPALTKDEDFNAREFYLNCLEYAARCAWDMESCVVGAGSRRLVEQFFSKCEDAASGTFWIRIKTLIDALGELLFKCNNETDGKLDELLASIFCKAAKAANPPKKQQHWGYLAPGVDPEPELDSLREDMETIITCVYRCQNDLPS